jgi:hypothetical protein
MGKEVHLSLKADFRIKASYRYMLCGWRTRSDIPLTSMPASEGTGQSNDVIIQIASGAPPIKKNSGWDQHSAERSLIRIKGVADFEVRRGEQIRVWPAAGVSQKDIEIFLFGPAWATLCHQRGMLPLHASAIMTKRGITAFAGHSGAGKSTTAALMGLLGYELVTDDILPISFNRNSVPGAWPYLRRLKLQSRPIVQLALTPTELVSATLDKEKYFVRPEHVAEDKWNRLDRIYLLVRDPSDSHLLIDQITGADSVRALVDHTYHFNFVLGSRQFRHHLMLCSELASKIAVYRLHLSPSFDLGSVLRTHLESTPSQAS